MMGKVIADIKVGDSAVFSKTVSEADIYLFAGVTCDQNPAHINESYARTTFFKTRIAHGMLCGGFISAVLGMQLPGPGTIYIKQELNFLAPVRIGDTITAKAEVLDRDVAKNRLRLKTTCTNQDGVVVVDGEAVVMPPKSRN
ncbi:MAG: MaoC family dehydratase [Syntrophobacterales bacterium]|jgi:3-hydroxybutyryl-CoA dehydratase|nr:MaoC family dehydratase [Syntrophobacterales bacterium]